MSKKYDYDSNEVTLSFLGIPLNEGRADGDFLSVKNSEQAFDMKVGADGTVVRFRTNNRSATIEATFLTESPENSKLTAIHKSDLATNGAGVGPIMVRNRLGLQLHFAQESWLVGTPEDASYGKESGTRTWIWQVACIERNDGGS